MMVPARRIVLGASLAVLLGAPGRPLSAETPPDASPQAQTRREDRGRTRPPTTQPSGRLPAIRLPTTAPDILEDLRQRLGEIDERAGRLREQIQELARRQLDPLVPLPEELSRRLGQLTDQLNELYARRRQIEWELLEAVRDRIKQGERLLEEVPALLERARQLLEGRAPSRPAQPDGPADPTRRAPPRPPTTAPEWLADRLAEAEPAYSDEQAERYVRELTPLVEQIAGRKFRRPPTVRLVDRARTREMLTEEIAQQFRLLMPDAEPDQVADQVRLTCEVLSVAMLGKYSWKDRTLYLLPGNLRPVLDLTGTDRRHAEPITRLVVAHELTHALQDQHIDLGATILKLSALDRSMAFNATIEGHAVFVQDQVGARLKLDEAVVEMARMMSAGAVKSEDPAGEFLGRMLAAQYEQIYIGGRDFIAHHHRLGGNERVWQILAAPPPRTAMIARPETYAPAAAEAVDHAAVLNGLDSEFGPGKWSLVNQQVGRIMIEAMYQAADNPQRKKVIDGIEHVQVLVATGERPGHLVAVALFVLADPASADALMDMLVALVRQNVEQFNASPSIKLRDVTFGQVRGVRADRTSRIAFTVEADGEGVNQKFIRISRGSAMVEVMVSGIDLADEQCVRIADRVFDRYRTAVEAPSAPAAAQPAER